MCQVPCPLLERQTTVNNTNKTPAIFTITVVFINAVPCYSILFFIYVYIYIYIYALYIYLYVIYK